MAQVDDILLDGNGELRSGPTGDFVVGDAANDFIKDIILAAPGHYKMAPEVGVNIWSFVNGNVTPAQIERAIRLQLEDDIFVRPHIDTRKWKDGVLYINRTQVTIVQ